jgi:hypothetical protein
LIDSTAAWPVNSLAGLIVKNETDGSYGPIVSNTANTAVCALTGGTLNVWSPGDVYSLGSPLWDVNTGLNTLVIPQYTTLTVFDIYINFNQDCESWLYFDGVLSTCTGILSGGLSIYEAQIVGFSSAMVDPTGLTAHTVAIYVFNRGTNYMKGTFHVNAIKEIVQ